MSSPIEDELNEAADEAAEAEKLADGDGGVWFAWAVGKRIGGVVGRVALKIVEQVDEETVAKAATVGLKLLGEFLDSRLNERKGAAKGKVGE